MTIAHNLIDSKYGLQFVSVPCSFENFLFGIHGNRIELTVFNFVFINLKVCLFKNIIEHSTEC